MTPWSVSHLSPLMTQAGIILIPANINNKLIIVWKNYAGNTYWVIITSWLINCAVSIVLRIVLVHKRAATGLPFGS
jgi:hypothetical protein